IQAGKLSDLFDDPAVGALGVKVLSSLDDEGLGRSAQVNQRWNQLVQHSRNAENPSVYNLPGPLIRPQRALTRDILESTHAIKDPFSSLIQEIRGGSFTAALAGLSPQEQGMLKSKFPNLVDLSLS